ncbi:periplasmic chaperone for outer membrane proteins SurA [Anseongella ginsenosidimutans]|uniref:Periplasmic chaperone for outer membrane proteins SurA n=1 Tax=Anseongella ginsenosidimutans TaxID=496056 RepID=A0A4V2UUC8_9SPHI|nr:peptidylprolyl isomerase [Anseongella ginsenosidimutans]TCS90193.1 periplasmic chaperone for outer membrane proteins SurA [Anseongella ginsenosidimutans]
MNKIFLLLAGMIAGTAAMAQESSIDEIIAVVGDKIILKSDVENQYALYLRENQTPNEAIKCTILQGLLSQKLLVAQAEIDSLAEKNANFPAQVEAELDKRVQFFVRSYFGGSVAELERFYGKPLLQLKEEFREQIGDQMKAELMQMEITAGLDVSPADIRKYYNSVPPDSLEIYNTEVEVGQIVIYPKVTEAQKMVARTRLAALRAEIQAGEDFERLAIVNSDDPGSASSGGDLGFVSRGQMVPEFEAAAFRLKEGELSQIIETEYGFHLIQGIERRGEQIHVRHILIKPEYSKVELDSARKLLAEVREKILVDTLSFAAAAVEYSDDELTRGNGGIFAPQGRQGFNMIPLDKINEYTGDAGIFNIIDTMEVGQISKPLVYVNQQTGEQGYRIVYYKSRSEPHRASLETDYPRLRNAALAVKQEEVVEEWFKDKITEQYVRIDESYQSCESLQHWLRASAQFEN